MPIGDMAYEKAALSEPMGCALNGLAALDGIVADSASVFGAGPIGLLMALTMRARGVETVTPGDPIEDRSELSRSFGFEAVAPDIGRLVSHSIPLDAGADVLGGNAPKGALKIHAVSTG